jgi:hypothetical protein
VNEKSHKDAEADHHVQILQIIPVDGWVALFGDSDGEGGPDMRPVVCWALVECAECDTRSIEPMVAIEGAIVSAKDLDSYQDVAPEADVIDDLFGDEDGEDDDDGA